MRRSLGGDRQACRNSILFWVVVTAIAAPAIAPLKKFSAKFPLKKHDRPFPGDRDRDPFLGLDETGQNR
ncbi:hypothetical protein [Oxynema sp. CENA135]|uniref:hypothetical protein n=1 Tax=Oxynema sp. CENA135 TaxID=984206 RepID=UPI001F1FD724|nr:hypothetical protein [Oxynema sp. CENA135]